MSSDIENLPYRPCVGIMLVNAEGLVWQGERIDTPGAWQMPQGGIEEYEELEAAAYRELEEEIGVTSDHVEILGRTEDWLSYDLPDELAGVVWNGRYKGQKMHWFLMRLTAEETVINTSTENPEFAQWQWGSIDTLTGLIVPFKRQLYKALVKQFKPLVAG